MVKRAASDMHGRASRDRGPFQFPGLIGRLFFLLGGRSYALRRFRASFSLSNFETETSKSPERMSAIEMFSSTFLREARVAIQTSATCFTGPAYSISSGAKPRTAASGPSIIRIMSATAIS